MRPGRRSLTGGAAAGALLHRQARMPLLMAGALMAAAMAMPFGEDEPEFLSLCLLPFFLYSKLNPEEVLDNSIRRRIFGYITANPGDSYNSMWSRLDIPRSTFFYHLKLLEHDRLVKHVPDGLMNRYYPASTMVAAPEQHRISNAQKTVRDLIEGSPGLSQMEIAGKLNVTTAAVNYHLDVLLEKNIVRRERVGLRYRYYLLPGKEAAGAEVEASLTPPV